MAPFLLLASVDTRRFLNRNNTRHDPAPTLDLDPYAMPEIIVKLGDRVIHRYFFDKEMLSVGRGRENDIVIENLSVSRNHAKIKRQDGKYVLTDMNSANGTLVNGVRIQKADIAHDDEIMVGKHTLHFILQGAEVPAAAPGSIGAPAAPAAVTGTGGSRMTGLVGVLAVTKGKQLGQDFRAFKPESHIGRASENDIRLHDWFVSKRHASIIRQGNTYTLRDLDSWRGTTVNGQSVREVELRDGDELVFGTTVLSFKRVEAALLPAAAPPSLPVEDGENYEEASEPHNVPEEPPSERIPAPAAEDPDDEFAPMTEDELEALESEADFHNESDEGEE